MIVLTIQDDYGVITRFLFGCRAPVDIACKFFNAHGFEILSSYDLDPAFYVARSRAEMERAGLLLENVKQYIEKESER